MPSFIKIEQDLDVQRCTWISIIWRRF